jgi:hypothetical protein
MRNYITFLTRRKAPLDINKLLVMTDDNALVKICQLFIRSGSLRKRAPEPKDPVQPQHEKPRPWLHPPNAQHPPTPSTPTAAKATVIPPSRYRHMICTIRNIVKKNIETRHHRPLGEPGPIERCARQNATRLGVSLTARRRHQQLIRGRLFRPPNSNHPALGLPSIYGLLPQSRRHKRQANDAVTFNQDGDDYEMTNLF